MMSCDLHVLVGGACHQVGVGGHDHACTAVGKVAQVSNDPQGVVVVERAGGFIGEYYLGWPYEEPGDGDPLLFAAAEFAHLPALVPGQPYLFQDFGNLGEHCFGREYLVGSGSQVDVVVDGLVWDEGVVLEEVAHIVAPVFSGFAIPQDGPKGNEQSSPRHY